MSYLCLITFSSPTAAEKALRLFQYRGYRAEKLRVPQDLAGEGCVTGVSVSVSSRDEAHRVLANGGVPYRKIYLSEMGENT